MEIYLTKAVAAWVLPPGGNLLLAILGLLVLIRRRVLGVGLLLLAVASLYVLSMPMVAGALNARLETVSPYPLRAKAAPGMGAIVVLGGGRNAFAPEFGGETVSAASLERVRYAARLHRDTGLPLLVTGGRLFNETGDEATLMKRALTEDFGVPVKWLENRARTTRENARYAAEVLKGQDIGGVYLVTHAAHMPRSMEAFERAGLNVIAAPTAFRKRPASSENFLDYFPDAGALNDSARVLHEYLGRIWYQWRNG
jgi:uncharacterized SAM-binding protein YcdF (DUF218 family)